MHHRLSGETHILSDEAQAILEAIPPEGAAAHEVAETLEGQFDKIDTDGRPLEAIVHLRLEEFRALGLLERYERE